MKIAILMGAALCVGCITPRSVGLGQTAMAIGTGQAEGSYSIGAGYQQTQSKPQTSSGVTSYTTGQAWTLPTFEGNLQYGLADNVGLNFHVSPAGLQPGVKITALQGPIAIAVLPQVAVGYTTATDASVVTSGGSTTQSTQSLNEFSFLGGARGIISFDFGLYAGLGYDFQYVTVASRQTGSGSSTTNTSNSSTHNLLLAVGYDVPLGVFRVRPEVAIMYAPIQNGSSTTGSTTQDTSGGNAFYFFPNVSFALSSKAAR